MSLASVAASLAGNAARTAAKIGDKLLEVNGESVKQMDHGDVGRLINLGEEEEGLEKWRVWKGRMKINYGRR